MKKTLLLLSSAFCMAATGLQAADNPQVLSYASINHISPNGRYAVSEVYGTMVIYDFEADKTYTYEADEEQGFYYSSGLGNCISNDGIVLLSTQNDNDAAYWQNGEIKQLPVTGVTGVINLANGITPDGSRICGSLGVHEMSLDNATMLVPVFWNRNADGSYADYVLLPHPEKDVLGEAPQYITANAISDDGTVIAGQIMSGNGMLCYPIVYTLGQDGEWTYSQPAADTFNPNNIEIPENPGDGPTPPNATDFMSDDKKAEYEADYDAWIAGGYAGEMPNADDYLTEEQKAEYDAAFAEYETASAAWQEQASAYYEALGEVLQTSTSFEFNNVFVSPDGKFAAYSAAVEIEDPTSWFGFSTVNMPWQIKLADNSVTKYDTGNTMTVTCVANDGYMLASNGMGNIPTKAYVLKDGQTTDLIDYINSISPEMGAWAVENMTHEVFEYDFENDEEIPVEYFFGGIPVASYDMKKLITWTDTPWDYMLTCEAYYFDFTEALGITDVTGKTPVKVAFDAEGNLQLSEGVASVAVYNINGACVASAANPGSIMDCALPHGVYIVNATAADGTTSTFKLIR